MKPATTWRLERAKQRMMQQNQISSTSDVEVSKQEDTSTRWQGQYQEEEYTVVANDMGQSERRSSAHSFSKIIPSTSSSTNSMSSMMPVQPSTHTYVLAESINQQQLRHGSVYSDASDKFVFDAHHYPGNGTNTKYQEFKGNPMMARTSNTAFSA